MYYKKLQILFVCLALFAIIILLSIYKTFTTEHFYAPLKVKFSSAEQTYLVKHLGEQMPDCPTLNNKTYVKGCDKVCRLKGYEWVNGCNGCVPPDKVRYFMFVPSDTDTKIDIFCGNKKVGSRNNKGAVHVKKGTPTNAGVRTTLGG